MPIASSQAKPHSHHPHPVLHCPVPEVLMRRFFAIVLVCFFSVVALGQAKHPFTFEDMMKLKRVGEPVPSPDGKWVLFSVIDVNLEANAKTSHIWICLLYTSDAAD